MTMDTDQRLQLTKTFISDIRVPEPPPKGFNPTIANESELLRHGLPLPPDQGSDPARYAKWLELMNQSTTMILPEFEILDDWSGTHELKEPSSGSSQANAHSTRWAGAVNPRVDTGDAFNRVEGSWTVPRAYPLTEAWNACCWNNGKCKTANWVGIDGYHTQNSHVLQGGTAQRCIVTASRQTIPQPTHAWVEWIPAHPISFDNFEVRPGDLMTCIIESPDPSSNRKDSSTGRVMLFNRSACTYSTAHLTMPKGGRRVEGKTAEWIVEIPSALDKLWGPAYHGATFIYDCLADTKKGKKKNLKDAILVDTVRDCKTINYAVKENDGMVGVFSTPTYPIWTQVDTISA